MKKKIGSKAAFIQSQPATLTASQVVENAKARGLRMSVNYVHSVRSKVRAAKPREVEKASRPTAPKSGPAKAKATVEDVLRAAAAEIGMEKAVAILETDRATIRELTGTGS